MRILFVCFPYSAHAARWIGLLGGAGWDIHVFPSQEFDSLHAQFDDITYWPAQPQAFVAPPGIRVNADSPALRARANDGLPHVEYLRSVIAEGHFDVVHSMKFQHAGYLTCAAYESLAPHRPIWIATNYGSDIYLYRREPDHAARIRALVETCDYYSAECNRDVDMPRDMGFVGGLFEVCPNGGGIDLQRIAAFRSITPPSWRDVVAIKGYEHFAGRAMTVLSVLEDLAAALRPYRIVIYAPSPAVREAVVALRVRTGLNIECYAEQETHEKILALHGMSRISIANSISDGICTSLLEAMAMGSFPIQSGTACADEWIAHGTTGFVTDPNDPASIKAALQTALEDDALVDHAAMLNGLTVRDWADSRKVQARLLRAYSAVTRNPGVVPARPLPARSAPDRPVLSVITPTYNRADFLSETITSVLSQSFEDYEYLIIDDGSQDDTEAVVKRFNDPRIRYVRQENAGETRAVNRALLQVKGDFFAIINSDDPAMPGAFATLLAELAADPGALIAYPDWHMIDERSQRIHEVRLVDYDMETMLIGGNVAIGPGAMFRREVLERVGLRNPLIRYAADLDYIFRLALVGRMIHVPKFLGTHRLHAASASVAERNERLALETLELLRAYGGHPLLEKRLRRRTREAFAVGSFSAAMVAPDARFAVRLLAKGFLAHPGAMLRRIHEHSPSGVIARLEEIGCPRDARGAAWFDKAMRDGSRHAAVHATARSMLTDPIGALELAVAIGFPQIIKRIRTGTAPRLDHGAGDIGPALRKAGVAKRLMGVLRRAASAVPVLRRL